MPLRARRPSSRPARFPGERLRILARIRYTTFHRAFELIFTDAAVWIDRRIMFARENSSYAKKTRNSTGAVSANSTMVAPLRG